MTKGKRILFWCILILFVGLSIWWIFSFPYSRSRLFRAIPPNAAFVSEHRDLATRWKTLAKNPLLHHALTQSGVSEDDIKKSIENKHYQKILNAMAGRNTVVAYVPELAASGRPAWIITSWIGSLDRLLSWGLGKKVLTDFKELKLNGGKKGWVLEGDTPGPYSVISLAPMEGIMVACLSSHPRDIEFITSRADRNGKRSSDRFVSNVPEASKATPDTGWVQLSPLGLRIRDAHELTFSVSSLSEHATRCRIGIPTSLPAAVDATASATQLEALNAIIGVTPDAAGFISAGNVGALLDQPDVSDGVKAIASAFRTVATPDSPLFVGLWGGDYNIKAINQLPFATMLFAIQIHDQEIAMQSVAHALQALNTHYEKEFIPRDAGIAGYPAIVIESTKPGTFRGFGPRQKPTFIVKEDWLILCSNMETLEKILPGTAPNENWATQLTHRKSLAQLWLDLSPAGQDIENALAVWSLFLKMDPKPKHAATRKKLKRAMEWGDAVRHFTSGTITLNSTDTTTTVDLSLDAKLPYGQLP